MMKHDGGACAGEILSELWQSLGGDTAAPARVTFEGAGDLPSVFATTDLAVASVAAAALAVSEAGGGRGAVTADRRLASLWFGMSFAPEGWAPAPVWDPIAGDYRTADGWIRLHTNAPHHRDAALRALGCASEREAVAAAVAGWQAGALEAAVVAEGGVAAAMRDAAAWAAHPQGRAVRSEPLVLTAPGGVGPRPAAHAAPGRPLEGVRVLDLTRILAGPVATRFLAGFGAEVLRIDPPGWAEPSIEAEITLGKRCARLDLKSAAGRTRLLELMREADVVVHGYRSDALDRLGLGAEVRAGARPGLVDVSLCAYGWSGPMALRRGYDSLVQMSSGIAAAGQAAAGADRPVPLPVQALDHATGYLMAAAAALGVARQRESGAGSRWRLSLARTAAFLTDKGLRQPAQGRDAIGKPDAADYAPVPEQTGLGPGHRLRAPVRLHDAAMRWDVPAGPLGAAEARWQG